MIKYILPLLFLCFIYNSCNLSNTPSDNGENLGVFKPIGKYYTDFNDDICKNQIENAKNDVKNGKLVYENSSGWTIIRYDDEMEEILNGYGIEYIDIGPNCTIMQECYAYYMDSIIVQRFGTNFIRQIEKRADSLFLSRWETKIYDSWDLDTKTVYKEGDAEIHVEQKIKFPPSWDTIPMKFERQFVTLDVFINNEGKLTHWEFDDFYNLKKTNERFLPEIKSQVRQIIVKMNEWHPGILMDKKVNSTTWLDIDLDKER